MITLPDLEAEVVVTCIGTCNLRWMYEHEHPDQVCQTAGPCRRAHMTECKLRHEPTVVQRTGGRRASCIQASCPRIQSVAKHSAMLKERAGTNGGKSLNLLQQLSWVYSFPSAWVGHGRQARCFDMIH